MEGSASDIASSEDLGECTKSSNRNGIAEDVPKFGKQPFMNCLEGWTYPDAGYLDLNSA